MPATVIDSAVFRNIFSTEAMRRIFSDENRVQNYLDFEAALARAQGAARHHPAGGRRRRSCAIATPRDRFRQARNADRAHRLSGAAGGAAARRALPRRARRVVPLGRDHAGHHRHRDGAADPRGAGADRSGHRGDRDLAGRAGAQISRHADGRPQQPAAGRADHLRLQDGDACWPASSGTGSA